jgi:hypothetical protein
MEGDQQFRDLVNQFINAYFQWELSANQRWHSDPAVATFDQLSEIVRLIRENVFPPLLPREIANGNQLTEVGHKLFIQTQEKYEVAIRPFVAKNVRLRCPRWGIPHAHEPSSEEIISTERTGETIIVRTSMTRRNGIIETTDMYRYAIVSEDGNPRLHSIVLTTESGEQFETLNA